MRYFADMAGSNGAIAVVVAIACFWTTNSYAASDEDAVRAGLVTYTAAVDSLDPAKMEALWAHDDAVMDIEPNAKTIDVGWTAVKKRLEGLFPAFAELRNVLVDGPHVQIHGDVSRSMALSAVDYKLKDGKTGKGEVFLTDVFENRGGAWLLVSQSVTITAR